MPAKNPSPNFQMTACTFTSGKRNQLPNCQLSNSIIIQAEHRTDAPLFYLKYSCMKSIYLTLLLLVIACSAAFAQQPEFVWADQVINYSSQKDFHSSSAKEALGEPNSMPSKGYSATAWEASGDDRREFLQLGFSKPIKIRQVVIAENCNPGAVVRVILYDT